MKEKQIYFANVVEIGNLYLEKIFFEFENIPVLFLCTDKKNNMYLCLCSEIRGVQNWTISPISYDTLIDMLKDNITIRQAFGSLNKKYLVSYTKENGFFSKTVLLNEIADEDLPDENEYLEDTESFIDFIDELNKLSWNDNIIYKNRSISFNIDFGNALSMTYNKDINYAA